MENSKFCTVVDVDGRTSLVEPAASSPNDPNAGVQWGVVELTRNSDCIFANTSHVNFVDLILSMPLQSGGQAKSVGGIDADAVNLICSASAKQTAIDGHPWDNLCMTDLHGQNISHCAY